ncbi:MAG: hypothetical protein RIA65_15220, partial [Woeseia sp.]
MKTIRASVILLVCAIANGPVAMADVVYVKAGQLLNPVNGKVTRNAVIQIDGERISNVNQQASDIPANATVIDLS